MPRVIPKIYRSKGDSFLKSIQWYVEARERYERLTQHVEKQLKELLKTHDIPYVLLTARTKSLDSFRAKVQRKRYANPTKQVTDISGARIVVYVESDVHRVGKLLKSEFRVHPQRSPDKGEELGIDKVGYRSKHFVCDLGDRIAISEDLRDYAGLLFEIQVRSILQHAWAEIAWGPYKLSGMLPTHIERELNLCAGRLESVDRDFTRIVKALHRYGSKVIAAIDSEHDDLISINSVSVEYFFKARQEKYKELVAMGIEEIKWWYPWVMTDVISELLVFGLKTIRELDALLTQAFMVAFSKFVKSCDYASLLRNAMMYHDIKYYFDTAWSRHWHRLNPREFAFLSSKYGEAVVWNVCEKHRLNVGEEDWSDFVGFGIGI